MEKRKPPPEADDLTVRPMTTDDLRFAAELHLRSLDHGLFPRLGPRFLRRYLHTYASTDAAVALVAERHGAPAGFLVGTLDDGAHRRQAVRAHGPALALLGLLGLGGRPRIAWWFLRTRATRYLAGISRTLRSREGGGGPSDGVPSQPVAVLSHVAVVEEARGAGIGAALVDSFVGCVRKSGLTSARLVTLAGPDGAGDFYDRLGWERGGGYVDRDGLPWTRYELRLS